MLKQICVVAAVGLAAVSLPQSLRAAPLLPGAGHALTLGETATPLVPAAESSVRPRKRTRAYKPAPYRQRFGHEYRYAAPDYGPFPPYRRYYYRYPYYAAPFPFGFWWW